MTKDFLDVFNEITENKYSYVRVSKAVYFRKEATLSVTLLVPYNILGKGFKDEDKSYIHQKVNEYYKSEFAITLSYEKSYCNEEILMNSIVKYFETFKPSILIYLKKQDIRVNFGANEITIEIDIFNELKMSFDNNNVLLELKDYLSHTFCDDFFIKYNIKEDECDTDMVKASSVDDSILSSLINGIAVTSVKSLVGGAILARPISIKSSKLLKDNITVCGEVKDFKRIVSKKNKPFYIFTISDTSGTCEVKSFSRTEKDTNASIISVGKKVLVVGKLSEEENPRFKSKADLSIVAEKISTCDYDESKIVTEDVYQKVPQSYVLITPKPYKSDEQTSMMDVENAIPPFLMGKSFVIFDLETTGLDSKDRIIEIGAVKMIDGKIRETFQTLVNPTIPIPKRSSEVNNIFDDMVQDAPLIEEVIGDFYKFCDGSVLVSYNIPYDMSYTKRDGEKSGYKFDHSCICALKCAQAHIKSSNHQLSTVLKSLGIPLDNAHRALSDTVATAKLFVKLAEYL